MKCDSNYLRGNIIPRPIKLKYQSMWDIAVYIDCSHETYLILYDIYIYIYIELNGFDRNIVISNISTPFYSWDMNNE